MGNNQNSGPQGIAENMEFVEEQHQADVDAHSPSLSDVLTLVRNVNTSPDLRLPGILILEILNWADFSPSFGSVSRSSSGVPQRNDQNVLYLSVQIEQHKYFSLDSIVFTVDSKDQGWSSYPENRGTRDNSHTFGEASVSTSPATRYRVYTNLHAGSSFEMQEKVFDRDSELVRQAVAASASAFSPPHDGLSSSLVEPHLPEVQLWIRSMYPGWVNSVRYGEIDLSYKFTDWDQFIRDHSTTC